MKKLVVLLAAISSTAAFADPFLVQGQCEAVARQRVVRRIVNREFRRQVRQGFSDHYYLDVQAVRTRENYRMRRGLRYMQIVVRYVAGNPNGPVVREIFDLDVQRLGRGRGCRVVDGTVTNITNRGRGRHHRRRGGAVIVDDRRDPAPPVRVRRGRGRR